MAERALRRCSDQPPPGQPFERPLSALAFALLCASGVCACAPSAVFPFHLRKLYPSHTPASDVLHRAAIHAVSHVLSRALIVCHSFISSSRIFVLLLANSRSDPCSVSV